MAGNDREGSLLTSILFVVLCPPINAFTFLSVLALFDSKTTGGGVFLSLCWLGVLGYGLYQFNRAPTPAEQAESERRRLEWQAEQQARTAKVQEEIKAQNAEWQRHLQEQERLRQEEERTREQQRKQAEYWLGLTAREFEHEVGKVFGKSGYSVNVTPATNDGGVDLELRKDGQLTLVQCKRYKNAVGPAPVRELYGVMKSRKVTRGAFVTVGAYTSGARDFAEKNGIRLYDIDDLVSMSDT
jgi:HJR/Mrr/RecB family endonuclease